MLSLALVCVGACGGKPIGGKAPRVSPGKAAGVVAAAAALTTLADPDHAKRIQERKGGDGRPGKTKENHEQVPEEVLTRSEDYAKAKAYMDAKEEAEEPKPPCRKNSEEPVVDQRDEKQRLDLIPGVKGQVAPLEPCVPEEDEETDEESRSEVRTEKDDD